MKRIGTKAKATSNSKKDKFIRCVRKLPKTGKYNKFAVCRSSTGYKGTSRNIGIVKPRRRVTKK